MFVLLLLLYLGLVYNIICSSFIGSHAVSKQLTVSVPMAVSSLPVSPELSPAMIAPQGPYEYA